ncbi:MAG: LuxR C-terminal-related transcriptional regulator [Marmoricola sp.]
MTTTRTSVQQSAKLQVPVATGELIDRARLNERLHELVRPGGGISVLAVCAPAGFGKTTTVSEWVRGLDRKRTKVAWCSLDATESHAFRFWSLVLRAVVLARPELAAVELAAPHRAGADAFLNDLAATLAEHPVVLVLENLHEIVDPRVLADLDRFVGLLPASCRLVLTSRSDPPLTSLQALHLRGELGQLRLADLAFTPDELRRLVPDVDEQARQLIWERTEGWPALVQLLLFSIRSRSEVPLSPLGGDPVLAEYLFQELLRRQDERVQGLMLAAGVPDLVPLDLVVELTGMTDAGSILDRLVAASGLVTHARVPGDSRPWYRFHPLLRSYLRAELTRTDRQRQLALHSRAATWYLEADLPLEAVRHARASEDVTVLEQVSAAVGLGLVNAGEASLLVDALGGTTRWSPASASWTHLITAAALSDLGRVPEALGVFALVPATPQADSDLDEARQAVDIQLRRRQGLDLNEPPEHPLPPSTSPDVQLYSAVERGAALLWDGQVDRATASLQTAAGLAEGLGRPAALLDALVLLALTRAAVSDYRGVGPYLDRAFGIAVQHGWGASPRLAQAHLLRAWSARLRLDDTAAQRHAQRARALVDLTSDPTVAASVHALDEILAFEADPAAIGAADNLHRAWEAFDRKRMPALVVHAALVDVRFSLILHRVDRVHQTMEAVRRIVGPCGELELINAMLEGANGHRRRALERVRPVTARQTPVVSPASVLLAAAFEARLAVLERDEYAATRAARQALELAERFDAPRALVDFGGEQVLTLLRTGRGRWGTHERLAELVAGTVTQPGPTTEVLTTRELEVLVELPTLRTVDEIAQSMFVSVNTLKTHLRSVYRKLGVTSRRDAVATARERGLL